VYSILSERGLPRVVRRHVRPPFRPLLAQYLEEHGSPPYWARAGQRVVRAQSPRHFRAVMASVEHPELGTAHAPPLIVRIEPQLLPCDYLPIRNVRGGWLVSQRFLGVVEGSSVSVHAYPVQLYALDTVPHTQRTSPPLSDGYFFWIPERRVRMVDPRRSQFPPSPVPAWTPRLVSPRGGGAWEVEWDPPRPAKPTRRTVRTIALTDGCLLEQPRLFVPDELPFLTLVHDVVRDRLVAAGCTGVAFAPLENPRRPQVLGLSERPEQVRRTLREWAQTVRESGGDYGRRIHAYRFLQSLVYRYPIAGEQLSQQAEIEDLDELTPGDWALVARYADAPA
jgi:hypothetical protein